MDWRKILDATESLGVHVECPATEECEIDCTWEDRPRICPSCGASFTPEQERELERRIEQRIEEWLDYMRHGY